VKGRTLGRGGRGLEYGSTRGLGGLTGQEGSGAEDDLESCLNGVRELDEIGRWNLHPRRSSFNS